MQTDLYLEAAFEKRCGFRHQPETLAFMQERGRRAHKVRTTQGDQFLDRLSREPTVPPKPKPARKTEELSLPT